MLRGGVHPWRRLASIRCRRLSSRVSSPIGDFWDINKFGRLEDQYDEAKAFLKGEYCNVKATLWAYGFLVY